MSYGFKATQPITEMFSEDFRKVEDQTGRAKSITMIKYNDVKQRQRLEKSISKKLEKAEKNAQYLFKDKQKKVRKALEKFEMVQIANKQKLRGEKAEVRLKQREIEESDKAEEERIKQVLADKQKVLKDYQDQVQAKVMKVNQKLQEEEIEQKVLMYEKMDATSKKQSLAAENRDF